MFKPLAVLIFLLTLLVPAAKAQSPATFQTRPISVMATESPSAAERRAKQEQTARFFQERQAQLRIDTAKLVALTAELQQQVNKTGINILSLDVIKKAQEIQKLAKSVQDKMRYGD